MTYGVQVGARQWVQRVGLPEFEPEYPIEFRATEINYTNALILLERSVCLVNFTAHFSSDAIVFNMKMEPWLRFPI